MTTSTLEKRASKPHYQKILEELRSQIELGTVTPGARLPSFTEMREQRGVSQTTMERVYQVLEQDGLIIRERGRGTFVRYQGVRGKTGLIGYIGSELKFRNQFRHAAELVEGVEEALHKHGLRIVLLREDSTIGWDKVDGLLVSGAHSGWIKKTLPANMPSVAIWRGARGMLTVTSDDYGGGQQAAHHLISLGHRRMGLILQQEEPLLRFRMMGYLDGMRECGIEPEPQWQFDPKIRMTEEGYRPWGYETMKLWMENGWKETGCTAIFVQNDVAAMGVIEYLQDSGLSVPNDISIISFDGTSVCDYFNPRITAIQVPLHQIGAHATEALIRQIKDGEKVEAVMTLPTKVKQGASTAPPAS